VSCNLLRGSLKLLDIIMSSFNSLMRQTDHASACPDPSFKETQGSLNPNSYEVKNFAQYRKLKVVFCSLIYRYITYPTVMLTKANVSSNSGRHKMDFTFTNV